METTAQLPTGTIAAFNCPNCGAPTGVDTVSCLYCGASLATRICSACFGAVAIGMRHCPHCGAAIKKELDTAPDKLQCPRCAVTLEAQAVGSYTIPVCGQCGGLWLDKNSFTDICQKEEAQESVLNFVQPPSVAGTQERAWRLYIPCPCCGTLMNHKNFAGCSGVIFNWCRKHGVWLDQQELHRIVMFIRKGGMHKARAREMEAARLREQKERADRLIRSDEALGVSSSS